MDFIYRVDKLLHLMRDLCADINEHKKRIEQEKLLKTVLAQCSCSRFSDYHYWFHMSNPSVEKHCSCHVLSFNPRELLPSGRGCEHGSDFYHLGWCNIKTQVWPKDMIFSHYSEKSGESKIHDKFLNTVQPLYEEVRPGFNDNLTKRGVIDSCYVLLLIFVENAFPGKYRFIKLVLKSADIPSLAERSNLKIKMRIFGYEDADIDKLCEYY